MAQLKDIATAAGVSTTTVHRVLHENGCVAPGTRDQVLKVVAELGYTPNAAAQMLKGVSTRTIGVAVMSFGSPFFSQVIEQIQARAEEHDYSVVLTEFRPEKREPSGLRIFLKHRPDGLILLGGGGDSVPVRRQMGNGIPTVHIGSRQVGDDMHNVSVDDEHGIRAVVHHLKELGHHDLGFVGGASPLHLRRADLFARAVAEAGCRTRPDWRGREPALYDGVPQAAGIEACRDFLARAGRELPTALVASNDIIAVGAMRMLSETGIHVPEHISITGFDDIPTASLVTPSLTTVRQPIAEMVRIALGWIVSEMATTRDKIIKCRPELVVRESTKAPAGDGPRERAAGSAT